MIARTKDQISTTEGMHSLRCTATTEPNLSAELVTAYTHAIFDYVALGIAAATDRVRFSHQSVGPRSVTRYSKVDKPTRVQFNAGRSAVVVPGKNGHWEASPPYTVLSLIRTEFINVRTLSYRNPFEVNLDALVSPEKGRGVVAFLNFLNLARPLRKAVNAEAERAQIKVAIEDATIELMVDEKALLIENAEIDLAIKREQLRKLKIENRVAQLEYAMKVVEAQEAIRNQGFDSTVWSQQQAMEMLDNVRTQSSLRLVEVMGLTVESVIADEEDNALV